MHESIYTGHCTAFGCSYFFSLVHLFIQTENPCYSWHMESVPCSAEKGTASICIWNWRGTLPSPSDVVKCPKRVDNAHSISCLVCHYWWQIISMTHQALDKDTKHFLASYYNYRGGRQHPPPNADWVCPFVSLSAVSSTATGDRWHLSMLYSKGAD